MPEFALPLHIRPLTIDDGMDIAMWRYPGPWAVYDSPEAPRPDEGYWAVCDAAGRLIGFCCLGDAARPVGLDACPGTLDVAIGIRPELAGHGWGAELGRAAVAYAAGVSDGRRIRCAVVEWNDRGLDAARAAGFEPAGEHDVAGQRYLLLEVPAVPTS
ncbi:MAG TPA: GNAT family N-acetyltransferase [Acidimicrobiia bacterium]|nr:GNAT family N-acetyltransferase [Acidimicrobiia bacterium]